MKESKKRSLAKSLSWRALATLTTMVLVYIFTGSIELSVSLAVVEVFVKLLVYYFHERTWDRIKWGTEYGQT
ncbi:MAG: DUF2061 domain-containing protein [Nanobdellota archaeon]